MTKHLLFIPFMALLATSCGGGHITTTPVIKNAPSASLNKPTTKNLPTAEGLPNEFNFSISITNGGRYYDLYDGSYTNTPSTLVLRHVYLHVYTNGTYADLCVYVSANNTQLICIADYCYTIETDAYTSNWSLDWSTSASDANPHYFQGHFVYRPYDYGHEKGYDAGNEEGLENGYIIGYQEGEAYNNPIIQNGQYAGLTAFPRRHYLQILARRVVSGLENLQAGHFDLIDTNANYTIYIKWNYSYPKTTFQDYGNAVIGELVWTDIISGNWSTSWFGKYDPELHQIVSSPKYYATDAPIAMSFYPEVYLGSTIQGDVDLYFMGTANDYALGFADGQTYTIQASETYNNVFTIFTPAFRAVANFFNLNIGPFKIWYFFAIPLIVSLLILVLRLVKH